MPANVTIKLFSVLLQGKTTPRCIKAAYRQARAGGAIALEYSVVCFLVCFNFLNSECTRFMNFSEFEFNTLFFISEPGKNKTAAADLLEDFFLSKGNWKRIRTYAKVCHRSRSKRSLRKVYRTKAQLLKQFLAQ